MTVSPGNGKQVENNLVTAIHKHQMISCSRRITGHSAKTEKLQSGLAFVVYVEMCKVARVV